MAPAPGGSEAPRGVDAQVSALAELIAPHCDDAVAQSYKLLAAFGSLARVMSATPAAIERQIGRSGVGLVIEAASKAVQAAQHEELIRTLFDMGDTHVRSYVHGLFRGLSNERLIVIFLDRMGRFIQAETLAEGEAAHLTGSLPALVARVIDLGAGAVVLAHNHLSGNPAASDADLAATRRIARFLDELGIGLNDHLIVAGRSIFSMRGAGLI